MRLRNYPPPLLDPKQGSSIKLRKEVAHKWNTPHPEIGMGAAKAFLPLPQPHAQLLAYPTKPSLVRSESPRSRIRNLRLVSAEWYVTCSDLYTVFADKGKQARDNIHSPDLANAFYNFCLGRFAALQFHHSRIALPELAE
jgi:hypothetical protein